MLFGLMLIRYDNVKHESAQSARAFSLKRYWAFWVSVFLMQVGFGGFYNFFTIYETSHGISLEMTGWLWSFGVVCEIVMLYFQGPLLRRNLLRILQAATFITAVRWLLLFLFPDSLLMTFLAQSFHAVSFALYHTAAISYVFSLYPQKRLAQQFFLGIAFGLGGAVGALLAGKLYGEYLFLYESLVTLGAFAMMVIHEKRKGKLHG
jgi:PPP family 3-phenylpropionic acid transporter